MNSWRWRYYAHGVGNLGNLKLVKTKKWTRFFLTCQRGRTRMAPP
jgi:hypothetical protein